MAYRTSFKKLYRVSSVLIVLFSVFFSTFSGGQIPAALAQDAAAGNPATENSPKLVPTPASGGILRFPLVGVPGTLDPALIESESENIVGLQLFEGLTQLDQSSNAIPAIASSWSSPNAVVWTFNLREDVYFHNGRQVKAGDFVYSWNRAKTAGGFYMFLFDDISSFTAANDFTFTVTLTDASATFPVRVASLIFAVIPSEAANTIGTKPVGTGAFKFVSRTTAKITLQRSLNYYDTPAYLDTIDFKFYANINTQWTDFQASKLDLSSILASQWNTVKTDPNVITSTTMLMQGYGIDMLAFPDVRVRQAIQRAIDRSAIASDPAIWVYDGLPLANGVVSPGKGTYDNSDITIPYDPGEALTLLADAGWADTNTDGILDNGAGSNLTIIVKDFASGGSHIRAVAIAEDLSNIGGTGVGASVALSIDTSISNLDQVGWISDYPAPENDLLPFATGGPFAERINYSSATFENHIGTGLATLDETARNAEFHAADAQLIQTDAAVIPLYYGSMIPVLKKSYVHDLLFTTQGYSNILLKHTWLELPTCVPALVLPEDDALLDNGRNDSLDEVVWDFDWTSCPNATQYHLYVYHRGATLPVINKNTITGSSFHSATTNYVIDSNRLDWIWKVKAYVNGKWGNWTEIKTFDVEPLNTDPANVKAPSTPALKLPVNNALVTNYTPRLDWSNSTPTPDHYELQVATDANFLSILNDEVVPGGTSEFTFALDLNSNTRYYWRVRAVNASNESSAWSATWSFRAAMLQAFSLTPIDNAMLDNVRPTLAWEEVDGATGYKLVISKYANFSTPLKSVATVGPSYTLMTNLPAKTKLFWRVKATGPNGPSLWSVTQSFTTGNPPNVPVLVSPANNALLKDYSPTLQWKDSTVPANTTFQHYEIQIDDSNDFATPLIEESTAPGDKTDSDFTPLSDLAHNTKYYWRVRAVNDVAGTDHFSAWSAAWSFRIIVDAPELVAPANGAPAGTRKPAFDWTDVADNVGYTIQVSASSTFGTLLVNANTVIDVSTYTPTINLPAGKKLYWRVRTKSPNGPSVWSPTLSFTTP